MPPRKAAAPAEPEEVAIPDSDDVPDEDAQDQEAQPDEDKPHGHAHTPGYPDHRHTGDGIEYDAGQVSASGGLELFPGERHDSDSSLAQSLQDEQDALTDLSPLVSAFVEVATELGYEVDSNEHPASPGGAILGLGRPDSKDVSVTVAYTE